MENMDIHLFLQREENVVHSPMSSELEFYFRVKTGDLEFVKERMQMYPLTAQQGRGVLSDNPFRNILYHAIVTVAMLTRFCVEGGMDLETAYGLSDLYIQAMDRCKMETEIIKIHKEMVLDYTQRMHKLKKSRVFSKHIVRAINYIHEHISEKITVAELAKVTGLTPNYLSKLFKEETGNNIKEYIQDKKMEAARNMLKNTDYEILQISNYLSFASQSYFTKIFHKNEGVTPKEYRDQNYYKVLD